VVAHGLRRLPSNRKISADTEREAVAILSRPVYGGFGPTPAPEYLAKEHAIEASLETVRRWMIAVKIWRGRAWGTDIADQHDRRCDQPAVCALCDQRLDGGKHEPAGAIGEEAWAAAGLLHPQGVPVSDCGENEAGRESNGIEAQLIDFSFFNYSLTKNISYTKYYVVNWGVCDVRTSWQRPP
jgi:hypothetical protein